MACEKKYWKDVANLRKLLGSNKVLSLRVVRVKCMAGSSAGDNYMSVVKRLQISGQEEHGPTKGPQHLSIIIKRQIPSRSRRRLFRCDEAFSNEINAYKYMVPLLEQYAATSIFPKCLFAGQDDMGDIIVLEDLKEFGYRMQSRLAGLDLHYCELVMKQLAKLHAASVVAKELDSDLFRGKCAQIQEIVYCKEAEEFYKNLFETSIGESLNSLRGSNADGCLSEPIRLIEKLRTKLFCTIQERIINSSEKMNVMCHGDLWVNNMMFTAAAGSGGQRLPVREPCAVRFFDLQAMRYTSPVFDILHFIYTSTKRDLREASTERLLETYCVALSAALERRFTNSMADWDVLRERFSLRNISAEYHKHVLYGLAIAMWILPAVTFDPKNIPNLDKISEMSASARQINCTQMLTPEYHSRLKDMALEFYQNGYLNSCPAEE